MGGKKISKNNIWNKTDFRLYAMGEKNKIIAAVKYIRNRMIWSWQRITRGYAECDKWGMYGYLQGLIPDMLQDMRENRHGSPGYLGENYKNKDGITEEQIRKIQEAAKHPITFDEDCEELSPAMLKAFRCVAAQRNRNKKTASEFEV